MTENKNEQGSEPGRPVWTAGLDLSAEMARASDRRLELTATMRPSAAPILRRLADAEMRVAQLERDREVLREVAKACAEIHPITRGEPDFLVDGMNDVWERVGQDEYQCEFFDGGNLNRVQIEERFPPAQEAWK